MVARVLIRNRLEKARNSLVEVFKKIDPRKLSGCRFSGENSRIVRGSRFLTVFRLPCAPSDGEIPSQESLRTVHAVPKRTRTTPKLASRSRAFSMPKFDASEHTRISDEQNAETAGALTRNNQNAYNFSGYKARLEFREFRVRKGGSAEKVQN